MKILKKYFISKNLLFIILPILVFIIAFFIHYKMVISSQIEIFKLNSQEVIDGILNEEKSIFISNLLGNGITYFLQVIGSIISLNVGLLFFGYSFSFKKLSKVVIKSTLILTMVYLTIPIVLYVNQSVYTFKDLYRIESNYTLLRFADDFTNVWLKNFLEMISITQILFVFVLSYGISTLMHWSYKQALLKTSTIYGIGFIIWACFSITMDLNFYQ